MSIARPSFRVNPAALRPVLLILALAVSVSWLVGAALFASADGSLSYSLPQQAEPPASEHNLASYRWGPTVRSSSFHRDPYSHHHPAFLVDGRARPTMLEKWSSAAHDERPWVELLWRDERQLERVKVQHAGARENNALTVRDYRLSCLCPAPPCAQLNVHGNASALANHTLRCARATGLRIDWLLHGPDDRARIYEIEAWGR